jgi:hypothetical protein
MKVQKAQRGLRTFDEYLEQMPPETLRALKSWLSLDETERGQVTEAIELVKALPEPDRIRLSDVITNIPLGPYGKPCPFCGRS